MCGRFTLTTPADEWAELFDVEPLDTEPRYNVAPTEDVAVVRRGVDERREAVWLRWGLIPAGTKAKSNGNPPLLINARGETITSKPSFREAFRDRRCLVVADGFYEWMEDPGGKRPFWMHLGTGGPFGLAAIWEHWDGPDGIVESCAIVTTDASADLAPIHDRMPVVLDPVQVGRWLDPRAGPSELGTMIADPDPGRLALREVSTRVSNVRNDDPECLVPVGTQVDLFS